MKMAFKGDSTDAKTRFMPFNSAKNESLKEADTKGLKRRDVKGERKKVELMPLPPEDQKRKELKLVSIEESLKIQREQEKSMKDLQIKNAIEKLKQGKLPGSGLSQLAADPEAMAKIASQMNYREPVKEGSDHEESEEEEEDINDANDEPDYDNPINA